MTYDSTHTQLMATTETNLQQFWIAINVALTHLLRTTYTGYVVHVHLNGLQLGVPRPVDSIVGASREFNWSSGWEE